MEEADPEGAGISPRTSGRTVILQVAAAPARTSSETIGSLVCCRWFVHGDSPIGALADELQGQTQVLAVAVTDDQGGLLGILTSRHLFASLGRPFGWEVYRKRPVAEWVEPVPSFLDQDPLYLLSEHLSGDSGPTTSFYAVVNSQGAYLGLFSQQDLVNHLSKQTQRDLKTAQELQSQLVEHRWQRWGPTIRSEGYCEMFKGVGGDFLLVRQVTEDRWFGCLCDVSGKGVAASLITTLLWGVLEVLDLGQPLETLVCQINRAAVRAFRSEKFVSGLFWTYEATPSLLRYADMGHSHGFLWVDDQARPLGDSPNIPLGIEEDIAPVVGEHSLEPGEGLFAYSDGVVENVWALKNEFPIVETVESLLGAPQGRKLPLVARLVENLALFRQAFPPHDDMSLVWFQRADPRSEGR